MLPLCNTADKVGVLLLSPHFISLHLYALIILVCMLSLCNTPDKVDVLLLSYRTSTP